MKFIMDSENKIRDEGKMSFEAALDTAGFGLYSYMLTCLAGLIIISYSSLAFANNIIVPTSACEFGTTTAQQGYLAAGPILGLAVVATISSIPKCYCLILGSIITGHLGDKFGRRRMLLIILIAGAVVNGIASISVNWVMMLILQFIATLFASGQYSLSLTIVSESVPMDKRNLVILTVASLFLFSRSIMAAVAIPLIPLPFSIYLPALNIHWNSWRTLLLVHSIPSLLAAILLLFVMESPKYVFTQGREKEAIDIIRCIHRINYGKKAKDLQIKQLQLDAWQLNGPPKRTDQIIPLFKMPLVKYTTIMTALFVFQPMSAFDIWLPKIANQFVQIVASGEGFNQSLCDIFNQGLEAAVDPDRAPCSLNTVSLLIVILVVVIQSSTNVLLSLIADRVGRRNLVICVAVICGVAGMIINLVSNAYASVIFFIIFQIGILVSGLYAAIIIALFPTHLRALAVAFPMAIGKIGSFASIQILNMFLEVNCKAGFYTFCAVFGSSAIIAAFLPDDRHLPKAVQTTEE